MHVDVACQGLFMRQNEPACGSHYLVTTCTLSVLAENAANADKDINPACARDGLEFDRLLFVAFTTFLTDHALMLY